MVLSHDQNKKIERTCWLWESVLYRVTKVKRTKEEFQGSEATQ